MFETVYTESEGANKEEEKELGENIEGKKKKKVQTDTKKKLC